MPHTGSLLSFYLTLAFAAQKNWTLRGFDAASAFLQSEGIDRQLLLRMPGKQPPPGTLPYQVLRALGSIYGTRDAGRAWYQHLKKTLEKAGWVESRLEKALFHLHVNGKLVAVLFAHVDDLLVAMDERCSTAQAIMSRLVTALHLGKRDAATWEYCGKQIHVTGTSFGSLVPRAFVLSNPFLSKGGDNPIILLPHLKLASIDP